MVTTTRRPIVRTRLPRLYPKQRRAIFGDGARYAIILASTKSGKTHAAMSRLLYEASKQGRGEYWWVAPVYSQAMIAYNRIRRLLRRVIGVSVSQSPPAITLPNGAVLSFKSGEHPDNLYGEDVRFAVLDEVSRMREEAWHAVRSTLTATQGPAVLIGNVTTRNWLWLLAQRARSGDLPDSSFHELTAYDAVDGGVLSEGEVEDARRTLPQAVFAALYLNQPMEVGNSPFGADAIAACAGDISYDPVVAYGVDLAKTIDWTVVIGLDAQGSVALFQRWQSDWQQTLRRVVDILGDTPAQVDSTGVGDPIFEQIARHCPRASGFKFSATTKQQLVEGFATGLQHGRVRYPRGSVIEAELLSFEYQMTPRGAVRYGAPEGFHDDCVDALALAYHQLAKPVPVWGIL